MQKGFFSNPKSKSSNGLKIGVFLGGHSPERAISLRSGKAVASALEAGGYDAVCLDPAKPGEVMRFLPLLDAAFIAMHGAGGEDGAIQRFLSRHKMAYVGSGPAACRRAFDKSTAKRLFRKNRIPTPDFTVIRARDYKTRLAGFQPPYFVKPLRDGSSIGVFCVEDFRKSEPRLVRALKQYGELLAEKKIQGREFTVGILGRRALPVIELKPKRSFYDYKAKYTKGMTDYRVPAPIPKRLAVRLQRLAEKVHRTLGMRDFSRVDMMADESGNPYVLELNAIPGLTELSLLPKAAAAAGISFEAMCKGLVRRAYGRRTLKSRKRTR